MNKNCVIFNRKISLQELWKILEDFVEAKKIISVGLSNIDTQVFISLYNWAKVFLNSGAKKTIFCTP